MHFARSRERAGTVEAVGTIIDVDQGRRLEPGERHALKDFADCPSNLILPRIGECRLRLPSEQASYWGIITTANL